MAQAQADAARVQAAYDAITRLVTVRVQTIMTNATNPNVSFGLGNGGINANGKRDGGTIHAATGLTVPGSGSSSVDSVFAMLAPMEEVISNRYGQADRNRPLLKAINSGASAAQIAAYASRQAGVAPVAQAPINVSITSTGVDLSKYIDVKVEQGGKRLFAQAAQEYDGGLV